MEELRGPLSEFDAPNKLEDVKKEAFPPGPLDSYRKQASFNWFEMKVFIEGGENVVKFKENVWKILEKDPLFVRSNSSLSRDEQRRMNMKRCNKIVEYNFLTEDEIMERPLLAQVYIDTLGAYDWSFSAKYLLNATVCRYYSKKKMGYPRCKNL